MSTITTRAGKGSPLTNTELDSNFTNLNTDKYQSGDSMVASELDLSAISSSIADTAVDVFVYDTRKDSDGGAWRKRTQHTSWYNETLNTATRGSRKEFPAVAVIVVSGPRTVKIYDGDDPSLPFWGDHSIGKATYSADNISSVTALNGQVFVGHRSGYAGYLSLNYAADIWTYWGSGQGGGGFGFFVDSIYDAERDGNVRSSDPRGTVYTANSTYLVSKYINDVAMTVLPNAPIDPATQLPIPTIAVATDGGVSVIKDDGSVVDLYNTNASYTIASIVGFTKDNRIIHNLGSSSRYLRHHKIPSSDLVVEQWGPLYDDGITFYLDDVSGDFAYINGDKPVRCAVEGALGVDSGLTIWDENKEAPTKSLVNYISSTYNTGWMNGDIKLATLSDTDATDVTGSELVTNGTFDSDTSGWTGSTGDTLSVVSGALRVTNTDGDDQYNNASQSINVEAGKTYTVSWTAWDRTGGAEIICIHNSQTMFWVYHNNDGGTDTRTFTATATGTADIILRSSSTAAGTYAEFDNISVRLAEEDRSVNGNGLQVFGTVTKNPVATGADLVAYSGFSGSNYLEQPYNSDLDFTDTVFINVWIKDMVPSVNIFDRGVRYTNHSYGLYIDGGNDIRFYYSNDGTTDKSLEIADGQLQCANGWHMISISVDSGMIRMYLDGDFKTSESTGGNFYSQATAQNGTKLGNGSVSNTAWGSMEAALFRISATAPTAEQIKTIYESEKHLFTEGAKCTLYGSSDAVTALAYDDTTDLLHVGTSAGRSDFSGLRRVSNTTDAVGTAISASNGMIVEE